MERCFGCSDTHCYRIPGGHGAPAHVRGMVVGAIIGGIFGGIPGAVVGGAISTVAHALLADPIDNAWRKVRVGE